SPPAAMPPSSWMMPLSASIPAVIFALSALAFPLAVAPALGLTAAQRTTWIFGLYLLPAIASFGMTYHYKIPLVVGWSSPAIIFLASIGMTAAYSNIIGAALVAGIIVIALGATGLSGALSY